jgi:hypothetical protein
VVHLKDFASNDFLASCFECLTETAGYPQGVDGVSATRAERRLAVQRSRGSVHGQRIVVDQSVLNFGSVQVGETAERVLQLRNTGDRDGGLIAAIVVADGDRPMEFTVRPLNARLPPGQAIPLTVTFAPHSRRSGTCAS